MSAKTIPNHVEPEVEPEGQESYIVTEGKKRGWKMNIAVVDTHGDLVAFIRMDGAQFASINVSQGKARTAARFRRESFLESVDFSKRVGSKPLTAGAGEMHPARRPASGRQ